MLSSHQKIQLQQQIVKECDKRVIDWHTIDTESMIDDTLSYSTNKAHLIDYIKQLKPDFEIDKKEVKDQLNDYVASLIETQEYVYNSSDKLYEDIYISVDKLIKGYSALLMVKSTAGMGKSYHINNALKKSNAEFVIVKDTTEAYLPQLLWENNGRTIWFQDVAYKLLRGVGSIEILKSISETNPEMRIVNNYNYNPAKENIPKSFIFTGKIVMDFNKIVDLKYLDNYNALISRTDFIELVFSRPEIINIMKEISVEPWQKEVTEYLISVLSDINALNLRTQANAFNDYKFCIETKADWKEYIKRKSIVKSPTFNLLYQYLGKEPKRTTELKKWLIVTQNMSIRQTERKIKEWIEIGELINIEPMRERDYLVSLFPIQKEELT